MTHEDLAAISLRVADLEARPKPTPETLEDVEEAFKFLSKSPWPSNSENEKREVLAQLAFLGWRHARLLGQAKESQKWSHRHDLTFAGESTERDCVQYFLETPPAERSARIERAFLSDPQRVFAVCAMLREWSNVRTAEAGIQASTAFRTIEGYSTRLGEKNEREWFLAELALLAGGSERICGNRATAELWLNKAEHFLEGMSGAAPMFLRLAYARLALQYDRNEWRSVLAQVKRIVEAFQVLGMNEEAAKTRFVEAMALKNCFRDSEAVAELETLRALLADRSDPGLLGQVLGELGAFYAAQGRMSDAEISFGTAFDLLRASNRLLGVANLKLTIGEALRAQGRDLEAMQAIQEAIEIFAGLRMRTFVAYSRLVLADTLLDLGRPEEVESEILRALPTLEVEGMAAEGVAALSILREAAQKTRSNRNAFGRRPDSSSI